jgi:hypothetical protein
MEGSGHGPIESIILVIAGENRKNKEKPQS